MRIQPVVFAVFVLSVACGVFGQDTCNLDKLDRATAKLIAFKSYSRKFPENVKQISSYCRATKEDIKSISAFVDKCLKGSTKQLASILFYSVKSVIRNFCSGKNKKSVNDKIRLGKCANNNQKIIRNCLKIVNTKMEEAFSLPPNQRIPHLCCMSIQTVSCVQTGLEPKCPNDVGEVHKFMTSIFGSLSDYVCGDYTEESDKCSTLPKKIKVTKKFSKKWDSFALPLLEVFESIDDPAIIQAG